MTQFERIQPRKSRSREETVPSTFPEKYRRASGGNPGGEDDIVGEIAEIVAGNEKFIQHLGRLGIET